MPEYPPIDLIYPDWIAPETVIALREDMEVLRQRLYHQFHLGGMLHRLPQVAVSCCLHRGLGQLFFMVWEGRIVLSIRSVTASSQPWLDSFNAPLWAAGQDHEFSVVMSASMADYVPRYDQLDH